MRVSHRSSGYKLDTPIEADLPKANKLLAMLPDPDDNVQSSKDNEVPLKDISRSSSRPRSSRGGSTPVPISPTTKPRLWSSDIRKGDAVSSAQGASTWSASSDKQLSSPAFTIHDRVFPIRSVVSVDPTQTSHSISARGSASTEKNDYFTRLPSAVSKDGRESSGQYSDSDGRSTPRQKGQAESGADVRQADHQGNRIQSFLDDTSDRSVNTRGSSAKGTGDGSSIANVSISEDDEVGGLVTARFKHIVTAEGHAIITGRDGDVLQTCEDEPIHIPGAIQGFGLLVALSEHEDNQLLVRVVSENSQRLIGYTPQELFRLDSFLDILSEDQQENLLDHIDFIRDDEADPASNGPEVFTVSIRHPRTRKSRKLWVAMHINPVQPGVIICEFELDDDQTHPLVPEEENSPEPPEDTLNSNPTKEEFDESTVNSSKPLRVLRNARKRKGEAAAMEVFNIMSQVQEQLATAPNLELFLKILVGVIKELTGFHRVMIYQFDSSYNGRVVTELVDPRATKDLYKGLNFPASDIPKQARELYKINKVRLLYDRDLETARLVCRGIEELENPLDLSYAYLRAMSPIHVKYLTNMAVRSSMSISINAFGELWGLIACHGYGTKGMRVSFPIRKMCRLVGDTASRNIERLSYASRLQARKLINTAPTEANPSGYIIASSDDLLKLFDADFGLLSIRGETKILGKVDQSHEALAMLEYMRMRKIKSVITSQDIRQDFPDLKYPPGFNVIAGLLLVPLSSDGDDFIVFFRGGQVRNVKWAGNPYEKFIKEGTEGYLEPRKSFKTWNEIVVGKCRDWTEEQVETAAVLCLVYGKFIEVWRQKEAAVQNSQLTRILLANSAHEVRTPLNAIINYLEIALEGTLDQETRENLAKSHSASKSLIYVINDLLDLTKTEEGMDLVRDEIFDLPAAIREATDLFNGDIKRKGIEYTVIEHPGVPRFVHGDQKRVRQAVANITANAVQHTSSGFVHVDIWLREIIENKVNIEIIVEDSGAGMSNQKLDTIFRDLEQVDGDHLLEDVEGGEKVLVSGNRTIGLGLAMVARVVRNMDGQLRLKSEIGKGSRFVIQLPFLLPGDDPQTSGNQEREVFGNIPSISSPSAMPPPPADIAGDVTLADKANTIRSNAESSLTRKPSLEGIASLHSFKSSTSSKVSGKSHVDRLIDAISGPIGNPQGEHLNRVNNSDRHSVSSVPMPPSTSGRPTKLKRSASYTSPNNLRVESSTAGFETIAGSKTPVKAVRMPDEFSETTDDSYPPPVAAKVKTNFQVPTLLQGGPREDAPAPESRSLDTKHLKVLVAEDDPVNSRIINKRLDKGGHEVYHTINGEECASVYRDNVNDSPESAITSSAPSTRYDVVLMDMQMPIVDGLTSTKMIRSFEKTHLNLSPRAKLNGRVPIFAVSASLLERERQIYIDAGFDGWILKPIDFKRLNVLLEGIVDSNVRESCLYQPGGWERGGWFRKMQPSVFQSSTAPSNETPVQNPPQKGAGALQPDKDLVDSGTGSSTPRDDKRRPLIYDERLNAMSEAINGTNKVGSGSHSDLPTDVSNEEDTPTTEQPLMDDADKSTGPGTATTAANNLINFEPTAEIKFEADASNTADQPADSKVVDDSAVETTNVTEIHESTV
ncbi:PHY1, histidine kinase-group VIII protein [Sclerotinia borealis F-4128]|uniref:PHY1, histidine kinase-group VIII protein n=1 Tax=Sclerotinia borealis (strain F-4128) TaxID=1432307 RepID=W9CGK1_SCLBF|nr:PHY1, histidine kinase-group VIII protein [Sclerotinia borealis F-4128]